LVIALQKAGLTLTKTITDKTWPKNLTKAYRVKHDLKSVSAVRKLSTIMQAQGWKKFRGLWPYNPTRTYWGKYPLKDGYIEFEFNPNAHLYFSRVSKP